MYLYVLIGLISVVSEISALSRANGGLFTSQLITQPNQYTNTWVVQVLDTEHSQAAARLAEKHGFINSGQVGNLIGYYSFELLKSDTEYKRSITDIWTEKKHVTEALQNEPNLWVQGSRRLGLNQSTLIPMQIEQQKRKHQFKKDYSYPKDPNFKKQWSLVNTGQTNSVIGLDLNVEPVWLQGVNGRGVVVSIMDDGLEIRHPDLSPNYDLSASWDFVFNDSDPTPTKYTGDEPDSHGTSCAGEIAMKKDNNKCGVGVAYGSNIGCLKFDLSDSSDFVEATPLGYKNSYIQVYSNSWGPSDIGFVVDGPGTLLKQTFRNAVNQGRNGKGSIFVWAAGNGGWNFDTCAADGYSSSIYTISVGSADQTGGEASYDEQCTGKMAVTYSFNSKTFSEDGSFDPYDQIFTTTLNGKCTDGFTGTSASTPLVSGVVALALQANPNLTWRDVQYLIAYTSNPDQLKEGEWSVNGGGLKVSHKYGFGAIDAEALVTRAKRWITVPSQIESIVYGDTFSGTIDQEHPLTVQFNVSNKNSLVNFLEHIVLTATLNVKDSPETYSINDYYDYISYQATSEEDVNNWLQRPHPRRGDIKIELTSPQGTTSVLLPYRKYDFVNDEGYDNWPFMSVHHWGESPIGEWILTVTFKSTSGYVSVDDLGLTLYGTSTKPNAVQNIPRQCDTACSRGCSGSSSNDCDACQDLRVVSSLKCVGNCPNGTFVYKDSYCTDSYIKDPRSNISIALAVSIPLSLAALVCALCIVITIGMVCVCKRKKKERASRLRYHVLQANDDNDAVPV